MTWAEFKAMVREHLHVHASRAGVQPLIERRIRTAVIDIQRFIDYYRMGQQTTYLPADLTADGECSVGALEAGAMPVSAEYMSTGATDDDAQNRHPLVDYPWANVRDLITGNVPITDCRYWISFDRYGQSFHVFPAVDDGYKVVLTWDGLKADFDDDDDVTFDEDCAEAVAEYVLITLAGEIDKNIQQREEHKLEYARKRKVLYIDAQDKRRQRDSQFSPFPKGCTVTSCCCCSSTLSALTGSGSGVPAGTQEPEGVITGSPGNLYILITQTPVRRIEMWVKESGTDTKTGWTLATKWV